MQNAVGLSVALKNLLIAIDFSFPPEVLLAYASSMARQYGGKLFLAHVIPPDYYHLNPIKDVAAYKCGRKLDALGKAADLGDIQYEVLVGKGEDIWSNLLELVNENNIDLVIAGTSGKTGLAHFVLGSSAERIFRHAPCPVLTVGPTVAKDSAEIDHILYASDLHNEGPTGIYAACLARTYNAKLTLLHVSKAEPDSDISSRLLARLGGEAVPSAPDVVIETGDAAEQILKVARARNVDLIVLGTHRTALFGSHMMHTAYKVVCEAPCPVFTVGLKGHN